MVQSPSARLAVFIQVIILYLAEIPVVGVHQTAEHLRAAVVGKADLTDLAVFLLLRDPLLNAQLLQALPGVGIAEHVHQVVFHMVGAQPLQLLPEHFFQTGAALDQVVGQLGGDVHLFPQALGLQNPAQGRLGAGIDIGGVKVIHALLHRQSDLRPGGVHVDPSVFLGKAQTAEAQGRKLVSVFVQPILHGHPSAFFPMIARFVIRSKKVLHGRAFHYIIKVSTASILTIEVFYGSDHLCR